MLDDRLMRAMFGESRSVAIIGAKDKAGQAVDRVGRYLLEQGYTIFPVHPVRKTVWGLPAVTCLARRNTAPPTRRKYWICPGNQKFSGCSLA